MSDKLFQERYRELPIFKKIDSLLGAYENCDFPKEEFITRLLMASEDALNWDTLCQNCGVLMDDNYAQYVKIEELTNNLAFARQALLDLGEDLDYAKAEVRESRINDDWF